jgi:hypothetical protein
VRRSVSVFVLLFPALALAVEGEQSLAISARFATLTLTQAVGGRNRDLSGSGGALILDYQRAVSDTLWLRAALGGSVQSVEDQATWAGHVSFGVTYAVDILKYVPYVGAAAGALVIDGGPFDTKLKPYLEFGVGIEVIASTRMSWGIDARFSSFLSSAAVFMIGPRISWHWGYF